MVNCILERRSAPGSPNQPGMRQDRSYPGFCPPGGRLERHLPNAWKLLLELPFAGLVGSTTGQRGVRPKQRSGVGVPETGAVPRSRVSRHWEDGVLDGLKVSRIQEKSGPDAFQADLGCLELSVFPGHS